MSRQPTLHSFNWRAVPHIRAGGSRHKLHRTHTETVCEQCELPLVYHPELSPSRLSRSHLCRPWKRTNSLYSRTKGGHQPESR